MDVIGRPRRRGNRAHPTFGRRGGRARLEITGLSIDSLGAFGAIGQHASIGYTLTGRDGAPVVPTGVKWSASADPADTATFGTGANPTTFTAADGFRVYLHATYTGPSGPITRTVSFAARYSPGTFASLVSQLFAIDTGIRTYVVAAASGAGLTWTYTFASATAGMSFDAGTRTMSFDTDALPEQPGIAYTVRATDQYGRFIERVGSVSIVQVAVIEIEAVGPQGPNGGDVPISYTIDRVDLGVKAVIFDATAQTPLASDFGGGGAPTYVDQGVVSLSPSDGEINLEIVGDFTGGLVRLAFLPTAGGDADVVVSEAFALTTVFLQLLTQQQTSSTFVNAHNYTVEAVAGETVVFALNASAGHLITAAVVDPGGPNQTTIMIRAQGNTNSNFSALADVVWPATGQLNVRFTFASGVQLIAMTAFSAANKTHQASAYLSSSTAVPENHTQTINTVAGQVAVMTVMLASTAEAVITSGVSARVGTVREHGARRSHVFKSDEVAGGTPETFRIDFPAISNVVSAGILGVYG